MSELAETIKKTMEDTKKKAKEALPKQIIERKGKCLCIDGQRIIIDQVQSYGFTQRQIGIPSKIDGQPPKIGLLDVFYIKNGGEAAIWDTGEQHDESIEKIRAILDEYFEVK